ncbi:translation initiation factor IF-5A [Candidatus Woesearchaeota archaeon]|nr:translation initiation factor IF-5A [Candidatus Woesearchaeota archaeon]MBW3017180.1 translation initiation factor IF-5A [Candidatus Woesearchaeota archaeon]
MAGDTTLKPVGSLKKGDSIVIDGAACKVVSIQVSRPGKHGHAKYRVQAVGLLDEKKREIVSPGHDVEVPIIDKRNAQVLSVQDDNANVMDSESYETFDLKIPEELKGQITEGVEILYWVILGTKVMKQIKP